MVFWFAKLEQSVEIHPDCFLEVDIVTRDGGKDKHTIYNHGDAVTIIRDGDFVKDDAPPVEEVNTQQNEAQEANNEVSLFDEEE